MSSSPAGERPFFQLSGAGNDFLALVEPPEPPTGEEIQAWCRRGLSLGADGLFVIERRRDAVGLVHFNADGGRAKLCLNGCRCAAALAFFLDWGEGSVQLSTDAGRLRAWLKDHHQIALEVPDFVTTPMPYGLTVDAKTYSGWRVNTGVPHFVLSWPDSLADAPVKRLGKALRSHGDLGAAGANIDFVRFFSHRPHLCQMRTFERGVEAETLACGTGALATVAAGVAAGKLSTPTTVLTAGGYELIVQGGPSQGKPWILQGDARILARGDLLTGAARIPPLPTWR